MLLRALTTLRSGCKQILETTLSPATFTESGRHTIDAAADSAQVSKESYYAFAESFPSTNARPSLTGLPKEVRLEILRYLLYWHEPLDKKKPSHLLAPATLPHNAFTLHPEVLRVNRQLHNEGHGVLYTHNTIAMNIVAEVNGEGEERALRFGTRTLGTVIDLLSESAEGQCDPWLSFHKLLINFDQGDCSSEDMRSVVWITVAALNKGRHKRSSKVVTVNFRDTEDLCPLCRGWHMSCNCHITAEQRRSGLQERAAFVLCPVQRLLGVEEISFTGTTPTDMGSLQDKTLSSGKSSDLYTLYRSLFIYTGMFSGRSEGSITEEEVEKDKKLLEDLVSGYCEATMTDQSTPQIRRMQTYFRDPEDCPSWLVNWIHCARVMLWRGDEERLLNLRLEMFKYVHVVLGRVKKSVVQGI